MRPSASKTPGCRVAAGPAPAPGLAERGVREVADEGHDGLVGAGLLAVDASDLSAGVSAVVDLQPAGVADLAELACAAVSVAGAVVAGNARVVGDELGFAADAAKGVALVAGAARAVAEFAQVASLGARTHAVVAEGLHLAVGLADLGDSAQGGAGQIR